MSSAWFMAWCAVGAAASTAGALSFSVNSLEETVKILCYRNDHFGFEFCCRLTCFGVV